MPGAGARRLTPHGHPHGPAIVSCTSPLSVPRSVSRVVWSGVWLTRIGVELNEVNVLLKAKSCRSRSSQVLIWVGVPAGGAPEVPQKMPAQPI